MPYVQRDLWCFVKDINTLNFIIIDWSSFHDIRYTIVQSIGTYLLYKFSILCTQVMCVTYHTVYTSYYAFTHTWRCCQTRCINVHLKYTLLFNVHVRAGQPAARHFGWKTKYFSFIIFHSKKGIHWTLLFSVRVFYWIGKGLPARSLSAYQLPSVFKILPEVLPILVLAS